MKKHIIRWVGAPFLALVLALAMAMGMAAPVWAADPTGSADQDETDSTSPGVTETDNTSPGVTETESTSPGVTDPPAASTAPALMGITLSPTGSITLDNKTNTTQNLTVTAEPLTAKLNGTITWTVAKTPDVTATKMVLPTFQKGAGEEDAATAVTTVSGELSATNQLISSGPGDFTVTVTYQEGSTEFKASVRVIFSGIILAWPNDPADKDKPLEMFVGEHRAVAVDGIFGGARDTTSASGVNWGSNDSSVVTVQNGELTAWQLGTTTITATANNGYSARFTVKVVEDRDAIAGPYNATTSKPLTLDEVYDRLNEISMRKTGERDDNNEWIPGTGSPLNYITGLNVSTDQGTLYYNYSSEASTGAGVAFTDRYANMASGAIRSLDMLYFVPQKGFKGLAEITFTGWARNGANFAGTIKVAVGVTAGTDEDGNVIVTGDAKVDSITYQTQAGEPAWFLYSDFSSYFQNTQGRGMGYVTFSLPPATQGTLYYNYAGGSGLPVSTTTRFTPTGVYTLNKVCFVPNAAFTGDVTISFSGADSAGNPVRGKVVVTVDKSDTSYDPAKLYISGERGKPVALQSSMFNDACRLTIQDTLSYVIFKLPDLSEGALYYNYRSDGSYDSRVSASTRYNFSGVPGIDSVSFVPASNTTGQVAISYTGYGSTGTSFTGTLYISMDEANRTTIRYFVSKNSYVYFSASDFYTAGLYQWGTGVDHVTLTVPSTALGTLRYDYQNSSSTGSAVYSGTYYVSPNSWQPALNRLSFHAENASGTVRIAYDAYDSDNRWMFKGEVEIQIGSPTPADIKLSCNNRDSVRLSAYQLSSVCIQAMSSDLSYIEITNVPDAKQGHLYLNYYGFGTGTVVKKGDRFYYAGAPGIGQLSFVPRAGFTGEAEITYIGYSRNALETVSGRVLVNVVKSTASLYFSDLANYAWAIDSVDYLYQNGAVKGVGGSRFAPTATMTRGDFTLMLVRAYGLTASGSASFKDVPADSYYADAIRIAAVLGVASGSNGYYNPKAALSRQDAMLMIFNALKASGVTVTNGLAADFSVYRDEKQIASYAREAVGSLVQMGVVSGDGNGYLWPRRLLSRSEAAKLLHSIMTL